MSSRATRTRRPNPIVMVLSAMLMALVVIVFARLAFGVILPPMRAAVGFSYRQAGNLGTATALGYLLFVLPGGLLAARRGASKVILGGLFLVTVGFAGLAASNNYLVIAVLMFLLGAGTAFCFAPMLALLATWYPERRGLMIGCMNAGIGLGLFLVGVLVPWLTQVFGGSGWRVAWAAFAGVAVLVMVLVLLGVRDPPDLQRGHNEAMPAVDKWRIFRNGRILTAAALYGLIGMAYIIQALFMVSYAEASGIASHTAGWLLSMDGVLSVICGPLWGWLSDHWGRPNTLLLSVALFAVGMALPLLAQTLPMFFAHFLLIGIAVSGAFTMIQATSTDQVAPRHIPVAFSYVTIFFAFGQFLGPGVAGWLIQIHGFKAAVAFACGALLVGLYLCYRIHRFPKVLAVE